MKGYQHWCTPPWLVSLVRDVFARDIDLDPFSNEGSVTGAKVQFTGPGGFVGTKDGCRFVDKDGFDEPWGRGTVYLNPPYSKSGDAMAEAEYEYRHGSVVEMIAVTRSSTNTRYWPIVERATAHGYFRERPAFLDENGIESNGSQVEIATAYWGPRPFRFGAVFEGAARIHLGRAT